MSNKSWIAHRFTGRTGASRRMFLKGAAATAAAWGLSRTSASAAEPKEIYWPEVDKLASERVNVAFCGIGNQGAVDIRNLYNTGMVNTVALCDVDLGGPQTLQALNKFPKVPRFKDFREMLDKLGGQIDAVCVAVPDFSHFPIAMMAMSLGKHVFVEKPLAHTFHETQLMIKAAKKYNIATQMGNMGRSGASYYQYKALVDAGIVKNVTKIDAFMNGGRRWHGWKVAGLPPAEPIPETLDWDGWLTTAEVRAYSSKYHQGNWRSWYDLGNGALGDWGAHIFDMEHELLNLGLPDEIDPVIVDGPNQFIFPQSSKVSFKFPARGKMPPVELNWYDGKKCLPSLPEGYEGETGAPKNSTGSVGNVQAQPMKGKVIYSEELSFKGGAHGAALEVVSKDRAKDIKMPEFLPKAPGHYEGFLLGCMGKGKCLSSFDVAGPLSQVLMLGVIAQRLGVKLTFDRNTNQIINNKIANELLVGPPPRKGWEQYYKV